MRKTELRLAAIIVLVGLVTNPLKSQAQAARVYLQQSVKAYGNWPQVKTLAYSVKGLRNAVTQAKVYQSGEQQPYSAHRIYNFPAGQLYETSRNLFPGGYDFHFATLVKDTTIVSYDIAGTRSGKVYSTAGKEIAESRFKQSGNHIAFFKVLQLLQSSDSLYLHQPDTGRYQIISQFAKKKTLAARYYFSRKTNLLEKVTTQQAGQEIALQYGSYKKIRGRLVNQAVTLIVNGKINSQETITIDNVNFAFNNQLLQLPAGYVPNPAQGPSKPIAIAKDIYLIERLAGDRNVLFVNMDDYITVIEAPLSSELSKLVIGLIRETVPNKPIKYVFTTHFHSDHTGGLRQYAYEGAQLLMAAATQAYVTDLLAAPQPDDWARSNRKPAPMVTLNGKYVLQDANHLIEFYEVPNSHAAGMSLAYFPKEQLIYQGDLLSVPMDGTLPFAIEVTQDMNRFLAEKNLTFTRMVGHHGHTAITPEMVRQVMLRKPPEQLP